MTALKAATFALPDGLECHYLVGGEGVPLVFLHGGGSRASNFADVMKVMARRYRVIAPDLRGFGDTGALPGQAITHDLWRDDVAALLDHIGVASAYVCGWSLGATIALNLAMREPGRVRALALLGAPHPNRPINRAFFRERLALFQQSDDPASVVDALFPHVMGMFSPDTAAFRLHAMAQVRAEQIANARWAAPVTQAYETRPDFATILPGVHQPVTLIVGADDHTCDMAGAEVLAAELEHARIVTIADCGHYYAVEQPMAVARALDRVFSRAA